MTELFSPTHPHLENQFRNAPSLADARNPDAHGPLLGARGRLGSTRYPAVSDRTAAARSWAPEPNRHKGDQVRQQAFHMPAGKHLHSGLPSSRKHQTDWVLAQDAGNTTDPSTLPRQAPSPQARRPRTHQPTQTNTSHTVEIKGHRNRALIRTRFARLPVTMTAGRTQPDYNTRDEQTTGAGAVCLTDPCQAPGEQRRSGRPRSPPLPH